MVDFNRGYKALRLLANVIEDGVVNNSIRDLKAEERDIERGDIIAVNREKAGMTVYQHFAVYIGNYEVIHYAAEKGDFDGKISIHKASFDDFIKNSNQFYVLDFDSLSRESAQYKARMPMRPSDSIGISSFVRRNDDFGDLLNLKVTMKMINEIVKIINSEDYHLYSAEETVKRAESKIGETKYNLAFNNCEHFAIWCKTGLHESKQVERVLEADIWRGGVL